MELLQHLAASYFIIGLCFCVLSLIACVVFFIVLCVGVYKSTK